MIRQNKDKVIANYPEPERDSHQSVVYQIRIGGHLRPQWTDFFGGMALTLGDKGDTILTGPVTDQAALYGLLKKVHGLGISLLSVNRIETC